MQCQTLAYVLGYRINRRTKEVKCCSVVQKCVNVEMSYVTGQIFLGETF